MTLLTTDTTEIGVGELHNLTADDFQQIYIEVSRRVEPGAGAFTGVMFLSAGEPTAAFDTVEEALAFIDALQSDGLADGIREITDQQLDDEDVVEKLQFSHNDMTATEYLAETGVTDPFNLEISPMVEVVEEANAEKTPQTASPKP